MRGLDNRVKQVRTNRANPGNLLKLLDLRIRLPQLYKLPAGRPFFFGGLVKKPIQAFYLRADSSVLELLQVDLAAAFAVYIG